MEALEARRLYKRKYRQRNKEKINRKQREWRARNSDRVREYQARYWERVAEKGGGYGCIESNGIGKRDKQAD